VNTSPVSCQLSPAASRSPAWLPAQARSAWTAAAGRPRVRRDRSVLVWPWARADRHTATCRGTGSTVALVAIYYLLPLDHSSTPPAVTTLVIGLVVFIGLIAFQVCSIIWSQFPGLRAIEALATSVPLFSLLFASAYVVMAAISRSSLGEPLTHTDALYFTVTVFSRVGFGDITAKTETARLVVTAQMIADLLVIGLGLRVILRP